MRARNLKPALFKNEILAVADPMHSMIFIGLWCLADREGRLEDRPSKIHFEINPGRAFEVTEKSLAWLTETGFIQRYENGKKLIQVNAFKKHQHPHHKEPPSSLPPPRLSVGPALVECGASPTSARLTPDSGLRIPENGFRIPETPEALKSLSTEAETKQRHTPAQRQRIAATKT